MSENLKRFFFIVCVSLSFVLSTVLTVLGYMAPRMRLVFATYQFFLIGVCVGALALATIGLILERKSWNYYKAYFIAVMISVFVLTVTNCVIFRVLGGEQFIRKLVTVFWGFLNIG